MSRIAVRGLIALAFGFAGALTATAAAAFPSAAARIDEAIRPNFGLLLGYYERHHHHRHGIWRGRGLGWGPGPPEPYGLPYGLPFGPSPYGVPGGPRSITVDCGDRRFGPTPISDAAHWIADGGVVYVRARGVACKETIEIDHPVIIAAEEASAFTTDPTPSPVVIAPPDGQPCVLVADGVREVELRGLVFSAPKGGDSSCVEAWRSQVALVRTDIDYTGDGSAVYVSGGQLIVREARIDAHTYDAAIVADGSGLRMARTRVRADVMAVDLTLGPQENAITDTGLLAYRSAGPGSVGLTVRGERSGGSLLKIRNAVICGFRVGAAFARGARGDITRSRICRATIGVMVEGADVGVSESAIGAEHNGVYVASGDARVTRNRLYDLSNPEDAVDGERGAGVIDDVNWIYLKPGCDHFDWNGRRYCRPNEQVPPGLRDESGFDRDYEDGWGQDGYDQGYLRDGPVGPFDRPRPDPHGRHRLRLFEVR